MGGKITLAIRRRFGYNSKVSSAGVMELVDVVDSKSTAGDSVPVRSPVTGTNSTRRPIGPAGAVFLLRFRQLHTGEDMLTSPALLFR